MRNVNKDLEAISAEFIGLSEESQRAMDGGRSMIDWLKYIIIPPVPVPVIRPWYL